MMIARKSILNKSKLSSGASLVSTTPWRYTESSKMTARISFLVGAQKLIQYNIIRTSHLTFAHQLEMNVRGAPARLPVKKWPWLATSPVALQNTPKKATRSTSTRHSRIISCEILEEKISILSSHRPMRRILTNKCCGKQHFHDKKRRILLWSPFLIKHMIQILRFRPVQHSSNL